MSTVAAPSATAPRPRYQSAASRLPPAPSDPSRRWTTAGTDALVVGDTVQVTELAEVPFVHDGRRATTGSGRTLARIGGIGGKRIKDRALRVTLAVVVDATERSQGKAASARVLVLDVVSCRCDEPDAVLPVGRRWMLRQDSVNASHLPKRVEMLRGGGPAVRTDEQGRAMLLSKLVEACGDRDPVEVLRLLVDPLSVSAGTPATFSRVAAEMVLSGEFPVRAWMVAQASGKMPIPAGAVDTDARRDAEAARFEAMFADEDDDDFDD